ncbi:Oidioi.mRNA.OKI2018_I69.chr2.g6261.t1.cds [Oikopleura dioica]|uniref:Mitoferrin-1 n=1 Tax=Oikopleura dioica TaxID=34765 RepID=A0ABN7T3C8_OIKDI|nr:Oidioi.mRNA.OKI2018_I69.chr2.g6261.t1.cds [Oikopleura dioica]
MNLPFSFIHFGIYDSLKDAVNPQNTYSPSTNALCGAVAGGVAAFVTTPLDVIKTVLNTQEGKLAAAGVNCDPCPTECSTRKLSGGSYVGSWQEAVYKIREINPGDPVRPFFRGCWARVITAAPGCALSWLAYEFMKTLLNSENSQQRVDTSISVEKTKTPATVGSF